MPDKSLQLVTDVRKEGRLCSVDRGQGLGSLPLVLKRPSVADHRDDLGRYQLKKTAIAAVEDTVRTKSR